MAYEPTVEELQTITKGFLLDAPPGEFMEVVTDIRGLLEDESILNAVIPDAFKSWNIDQKLQVENGDHKTIICKESEVGTDEYFDATAGEVVEFDHITRKITGTHAGSSGASNESSRAALQGNAEEYIYDHYAEGTAGVYGGKGSTLILVISAAKFEPRNFWSGRWRSVWTIDGTTMSGKFDAHIHFYEDGNVQAKMVHEVKGVKSKKADAKSIIAAIKAAESAYQQKLAAKYGAMDSTTFKALRRQLPITATKIDWDKISHAKMGGKGNLIG